MIWQHWLLLPDSGHLTLHPTAVTCHPCLMAVTCHPRGRRPPGTMALCVVSGIRRRVRACDVPVRGTLRVSASYGPWLLGARLFVTTGPQWGALACRGSRAALCLGRPRGPVARTHLASAAQGRGGPWGKEAGPRKTANRARCFLPFCSFCAVVSHGEFSVPVTIRKMLLLLSHENFAFCGC